MDDISQHRIAVRIGLALVQGAVLFVLYRAAQDKTWPATDGLLFAPMVATALFVPLAAIIGITTFRQRSLTVWLAIAVAVCVGLAFYDIFRDPFLANPPGPRNLPTAATWFGLTVILFIGHALFAAGDTDGRWIATYSQHYDTAWKLGVQLALALLFLGVFWILVWLGAELFRLIQIEYFATMIRKEWFSIPATTIVLAGALHLTDVRAEIVRGTRTLALNLLSWLLPVMLLIVIAFLAALPFTGLEVLWATRRATAMLLTATAALVVLINCAYQDGRADGPIILRHARLLAGVALIPLVALAAYGLWLRVQQYGWTTSRIHALACVTVGACYALGYTVAAVRSRLALRELEITNVVAALAIIAILLASLTPIADPARISVADQVSRLERGDVSPEQFDFAFLRFKAGRYGEQALERLKQKEDGPNAARISLKANEALDWRSPPQTVQTPRTSPSLRAQNIKVLHPAGVTLPDGFVEAEWTGHPRPWQIPSCLVQPNSACEAILMDLDGDGTAEILLFNETGGGAAAFRATTNRSWQLLGTVLGAACQGVREALRAGKFEARPPTFKEIEANGHRLRVNVDCPETIWLSR